MLTDLEIEDYQAIRKAALKLGRFTVVTGPTGSGKSALLRALRLLAFNARGTSYVRVGAKQCKVAVGDSEGMWAAGVERGNRGKDCYRTAQPSKDLYSAAPDARTFTKLAGGVPDEVTALLKLTGLNFAGQLDRPYLLDDSAGQVARTLGQLTNVTLVLEAAREANRRRMGIKAELERAERQLAGLAERAQKYSGLKQRRDAAAEAEVTMRMCVKIQEQMEKLQALGLHYRDEDARLAAARVAAQAAEPPSGERLDELRWKLASLGSLKTSIMDSSVLIVAYREQSRKAELMAADEHEKLHEMLLAAGICPTCNQPIQPLCACIRA